VLVVGDVHGSEPHLLRLVKHAAEAGLSTNVWVGDTYGTHPAHEARQGNTLVVRGAPVFDRTLANGTVVDGLTCDSTAGHREPAYRVTDSWLAVEL
jgi:predicted phosphodiesterase